MYEKTTIATGHAFVSFNVFNVNSVSSYLAVYRTVLCCLYTRTLSVAGFRVLQRLRPNVPSEPMKHVCGGWCAVVLHYEVSNERPQPQSNMLVMMFLYINTCDFDAVSILGLHARVILLLSSFVVFRVAIQEGLQHANLLVRVLLAEIVATRGDCEV